MENDIQGAVGEVAALDMLENLSPVIGIEYTAFLPGGPVDDVDFRLTLRNGETCGIETKTLLFDKNKRLLPINKAAHEKCQARDSSGYLPVISSFGSPRAEIGRLIFNEEVEGWTEHKFGYGDPAFAEPISAISSEFLEMPESTLWASVRNRTPIFTKEECIMLCLEARKYPHDAPLQNLPIRSLFSAFKRTAAGQAVWALADKFTENRR